jgi:hypothetical protein
MATNTNILTLSNELLLTILTEVIIEEHITHQNPPTKTILYAPEEQTASLLAAGKIQITRPIPFTASALVNRRLHALALEAQHNEAVHVFSVDL